MSSSNHALGKQTTPPFHQFITQIITNYIYTGYNSNYNGAKAYILTFILNIYVYVVKNLTQLSDCNFLLFHEDL